MASNVKYGRVTTEHGTIGEDEPIFIVRGQDRLATHMIVFYAHLAELAGSPTGFIENLENALEDMYAWQEENGCRVPGLGE